MLFKKSVNLGVVLSVLMTVVLFALSYLLNTSLYVNLTIFNATPLFFLPLITAICIFSSFWSGVAAGLVAGILLDTVSNVVVCFNSAVFLIIAVAVWLLANNLFNKNIGAALTLSLIASLFYKMLWWLVNYFPFLSLSESLTLLLEYAVPSAVYSALFIVPFFFVYRWINKIKTN